MTTAASLMVRIGCDAEDFTRGMTRAEKAAKKGFNEIGEAGKRMTEIFSVEFALAAAEFAHLAADAQDASARMDRVFGAAAGEMKEHLEALTSTIPETVAGLQTLAVKADNLLQGLGYGADKAAGMSVEMVKLAGDMAAFARVPIADAMDALDRGLAGKTKGLLQFGIAIKEQEIHQEALRRGLIDDHRVLTQLGTAEIVESLIRQRATRITGEAARTAGQASNSFRFLKQSVEEMGVSIGNITLPAVVSVVGGLRSIVEAVEHSSKGVKNFLFAFGGIAAAVGPAALAFAALGKTIITFTRAVALLTAGEGIAAVVGSMAAAPFATVVAGLAAIALALREVVLAGEGFGMLGQLIMGANGNDEAEAVTAAGWTQQYAAIKALHDKRLAKKHEKPEKPGALSVDNRPYYQQLQERVSFGKEFYRHSSVNDLPMGAPTKNLHELRSEAMGLLKDQHGELNTKSNAASTMIDAITKVLDVRGVVMALMGKGNIGVAVGAAAPNREETAASLAQSKIAKEAALRLRELSLRTSALSNTFDAARLASVELGEQVRAAAHSVALAKARFLAGWAPTTAALKIFGAQMAGLLHPATAAFGRLWTAIRPGAEAVGNGLKKLANVLGDTRLAKALKPAGGVVGAVGRVIGPSAAKGLIGGLAGMLSPLALGAMAAGKVLQGLQPVIDQLMGPMIAFGQILGVAITPILKPLFQALKFFGMATALTAEVLYGAAAGIAHVVGGLVVTIGKFISKIPFLGGIGDAIQDFGNNILNLGQSFSNTSKDLGHAFRELQNIQFKDAANGINLMTQAATMAALNIPQGFKVALAQFNAQPAQRSGTPWYPSAASASQAPTTITININGSTDPKTTATAVLKALQSSASRTFRDSTRWPELQTV